MELFKAIMEKDPLAIKQYHKKIFRLLFKLAYNWIPNKAEANDIVSMAFARSLSGDTPFNDLDHIKNHMCQAVKWACQDKLKKAGQVKNVYVDNMDEIYKRELQFEHDYIDATYVDLIYAEINSFKKPLDRKILLRTMASFTPAEIARETGKTPKYIQRRLKKLTDIIRNQLNNKNTITVLLLLSLLNISVCL